MASRRSGRRSALTLWTSSNSTGVSHAGQGSSTLRKIDMRFSSARARSELGQPVEGRVLGAELLGLPAGIELGEPLARGAELISGEALRARRGEIADPVARVGLVVDALADGEGVAVGLAPVDVGRRGERVPSVESGVRLEIAGVPRCASA